MLLEREPVVEALLAAIDEVAGGNGLLAVALAASDRDAVFDAAIHQLGDAGPTVLVVEDVHWADEATWTLRDTVPTAPSSPERAGTGGSARSSPERAGTGLRVLRGELERYLKRAGIHGAEPFEGCPKPYAAGLNGDRRTAARRMAAPRRPV